MKKLLLTIASVIFFVCSFLFSQSSVPPAVIDIPTQDAPAVPSGLKVTCLTDPNNLKSNQTCPVIEWNEYEYWVYSFVDNRDAMSIVAYTEDGTFVKRWDKNGARYITKIAVNGQNKTISLIGQGNETITLGWNEIYLPVPPEAGKVPSKIHPKIPDGSKMACFQSADVMGAMDTCYVLEWGDYTYWAYSYIDNRISMNVVAYDEMGNIVRKWEAPGARYLYKITVDPAAQTVTFWGQANQTVSMQWNQLMVQKN